MFPADWALVLALFNPVLDTVRMEVVSAIAAQLRDQIVLHVVAEADRALVLVTEHFFVEGHPRERGEDGGNL